MTNSNDIIVYGAYGYTGQLIVEELVKNGHQPTVAGRNEERLIEFVQGKRLLYLCFDLSDSAALEEALSHHKIVIHCAGPFIHTALPMVQACLKTNTHYIDITGEFQVFEQLNAIGEKAKKAGIMILPGAGFDVVPSDCLAAHLYAMLPDATHLTLAFTGLGGGLSRGTAKTMVENADQGQWLRKGGKLIVQSGGKSVCQVNYGTFHQVSVGISWGDISTAYRSTSIPNIEVFVGSTEKQIRQIRWMAKLSFLLKLPLVKHFLKRQIDKKPPGPSAGRRTKSTMHLWGKVENDKGDMAEARLTTPNGYTLTAKTAVLITQKILSDDYKSGFQTPSSAYGKELISEVEGVHWV